MLGNRGKGYRKDILLMTGAVYFLCRASEVSSDISLKWLSCGSVRIVLD